MFTPSTVCNGNDPAIRFVLVTPSDTAHLPRKPTRKLFCKADGDIRLTGADQGTLVNYTTLASANGTTNPATVTADARTDLASANGTTNPAIVSSAALPFTAADVGRTLHVTAGANWTAGNYTIVSVTAGLATLNAAVGTAAGLTAGSGTVGPFTAADVGRVLLITAGANWTVGAYKIASVALGVATLDAAVGTTVTLTNGSGTIDTDSIVLPVVAGVTYNWAIKQLWAKDTTATVIALY